MMMGFAAMQVQACSQATCIIKSYPVGVRIGSAAARPARQDRRLQTPCSTASSARDGGILHINNSQVRYPRLHGQLYPS